MQFWTPKTFAAITGGRFLSPPSDPDVRLAGLSIDSRGVAPGGVFLAVRGARLDGHDYLGQAAGKAALLIVSDSAKAMATHLAAPCLLVSDTVVALQQLASAYRDELARAGTKVIGVAGSNGKTTTRNLIHAALSAGLRGTQSPKSFNNHIGVPLTLLAAKAGDDFVVVEVGTNHPGELETLARIVRPDVAVVTSIGHEHMEFFRSLDGVAREESAILCHLWPGDRSVAVVESKALARFEQLGLRPALVRVIGFGAEGAELTLAGDPVVEGDGQVVAVRGGVRVRLGLLGRYNAVNALAAVAVGRWMGMDDQRIAAGLAQAQPVEMRLNILHLGTPAGPVVVINDAYNANPDSVAGALATLKQMPLPQKGGRRVVILGDMRELGDEGPQLHRAIGRVVGAEAPKSAAGGAAGGVASEGPDSASGGTGGTEGGFHLAVFIGKLAGLMAEAVGERWPAERIHAWAEWNDDLPGRVAELLCPGDLILIKASRGEGLERLIPAMERRFGARGSGEGGTATALPPHAALTPAPRNSPQGRGG
jgi:UDP-N-acetylmuramoyl-tripeptide--D-alanyl-D-alanine ligase